VIVQGGSIGRLISHLAKTKAIAPHVRPDEPGEAPLTER
jgi:hypothetical protein